MSIPNAGDAVTAARQARARSIEACLAAEGAAARAAALRTGAPTTDGRPPTPSTARPVAAGPGERDLERAMVHSRRIALAIGMVMQAQGIGEGEAFTVLRTTSRERGLKLAAVADDIVRAAGPAR